MDDYWNDLYLSQDNGVYSVYSEFDIEKHKETYINYLEVIIDSDGKVHYAVPSHQEATIRFACKKLNVSREQLEKMVLPEYYADFGMWLMTAAEVVQVWQDGISYALINEKQYETLSILKEAGVYKGMLPKTPIPSAKIINIQDKIERCHRCEYLGYECTCTNKDYIDNMYEVVCVHHFCSYYKNETLKE